MTADIYRTYRLSHPSNEPRTTNGSELYHRHLKDQYYNPHPSLYNFIEMLKQHQIEVYLKMQSNGRKTTKRSYKVNYNINALNMYAEKKFAD
jgi:hypothetical protein